MAEEAILRGLGRLEGKMDSLIASIKEINHDVAKHDSRIRTLESRQSWVIGAAAVLGLGLSLAVGLVGGY